MSSSSEDDKPLAARAAQVKPNSNGAAAPTSNGAARNGNQPTPTSSRPASGDDDSEQEASSSQSESDASSSDSDDDVPLSQRKKPTPKKKPAAKKQPIKRKRESTASAAAKRPKREGGKASKGGPKWETLVHSGVQFPPEYEPHGVKMLYDGKPVDLTPEQEEVASMFAIMKDTDYMQKPNFLKNFWDGFKEVSSRLACNSSHSSQPLGGSWAARQVLYAVWLTALAACQDSGVGIPRAACQVVVAGLAACPAAGLGLC
jgi:DNA topoisomerase-1